MKLIHFIHKNYVLQRETKGEDQLGFLLTNAAGGYLWIADHSSSRYQGWFLAPERLLGKSILKIVEDIQIVGSEKIKEIKNNFSSIERVKGGIKEHFFLPLGLNSLVYEIDHLSDVDLFLDIKEYNDHNDWERHYELSKESDVTIIRYTHPGFPMKEIYVAVLTDYDSVEMKREWIMRSYAFDRERNSPPFERYVFKALRCRARQIVISVSEIKDKAIGEAKFVYKNLPKLKNQRKAETKKLLEILKKNKKLQSKKIINKKSLVNIFCALNSLESLLVSNKNNLNLYAGLPWFFQFWRRDTAICLKALGEFWPQAAKEIFLSELRYAASSDFESKSADDIGWLFKRARDLYAQRIFGKAEIKDIFEILEAAIEALRKGREKDGLICNGPKETWMDSIPRSGARLEIQALWLNMYELAGQIAPTSQKTERYWKMEAELKTQIYAAFWNGKYLVDGIESGGRVDFTIRPNIFLAAYIYPDLLDQTEWGKCFKYVLPRLWLKWGGLASLDVDSAFHHIDHTGENPISYHNGDSWFYVNNIAAIVMNRIDPRRFDFYIKKIFEASSYDFLWSGILGYASELSPAKRFDSSGALAQAWSSATYLELFLEKKRC